MRAPLTIAALAAITGLGCHFGTRVERFPPAQGPAGVTAVLERKRPAAPILGELLALTDSALYVLRDGRRVTLVPFRVIRQGTFERMGDAAVVYEGRTPPPASPPISSRACWRRTGRRQPIGRSLEEDRRLARVGADRWRRAGSRGAIAW